MKKKVLFSIVAVALFAVAIGLNMQLNEKNTAKADINPDCPNGCVANGPGCYCYDWYPCLKEYNWGNHQLERQ